MKNNIKGFSLIEVIIATSIITITVFGVYKLIGENNKIITNSGNLLQINSLFPVIEQCIESLNSPFNNSYVLNNISLGQSLDGCSNSSSGTLIDEIEMYFNTRITNSGSNFIDWEITINSESSRTQTGFYKQIKK